MGEIGKRYGMPKVASRDRRTGAATTPAVGFFYRICSAAPPASANPLN
jgi:hypothetical protein